MSGLLFVYAVLAVILLGLLFGARRTTIYDRDFVGYFIIVNELTGNPCLNGRPFRTQKSAERHLIRLMKQNPFFDTEMFTVHQIIEEKS